jgi:Tfp pilus assembly protein FimT
MAAMQRLLFSLNPKHGPQGYSLKELCVVLCLLAICASWAVPNLSHWLWRLQVETVLQSWVGDLQQAQLQALRGGQNLSLERLGSCQFTPLPKGDWRCGWQVLPVAGDLKPLRTHALSGDVLVLIYPANNQLPINGHGETVAGGLRVTVQAKRLKTMVRSICINNTGRMRVVAAEVCT